MNPKDEFDPKALQLEYQKLFFNKNKRFKLSHYLTVVPKNNELLLFSGLSGEIVLIKKRAFENIIKNLNRQELDIYGYMLQRKYIIVPAGLKEKDFARLIFKTAVLKDENAIGLTLVLTLRCNFACIYCFEKEEKLDLTKEMVDKAFAMEFAKAKKHKPSCFDVTFYGGEPLLCPEVMSYAVKKSRTLFKKLGIKSSFSIITNGSVFNPKIARLFAAEKDLESVQITLDGPKEIHDRRRIFKNGKGSMALILKNLPKWLNLAQSVVIRVNVDQENSPHLTKLLKILNPWRKKEISFFLGDIAEASNPKQNKSLNIFDYKKIEKKFYDDAEKAGFKTHRDPLLKSNVVYCGASWGSPSFVGPDGELYACDEEFCNKDCSVGNVFDGYDKKKARRWLKYNVINLKRCLNCKHIFFCGGPCPARAMKGNLLKEFCGNGFKDYAHKHFEEIKHFALQLI
jgi:uncharacterized protein